MSNRDLIRRLRETFERRRYGSDEADYDPDFDLFDVAADALSAHEWSTDMDAAPRDGTAVLLWFRLDLRQWSVVAFWGEDSDGEDCWLDNIDAYPMPADPVAWKHIAPPDNRTGKE